MPNKTFLVVLITIFIDLLGFGILIPILPVLFSDPVTRMQFLGDITQSQSLIWYGFLLGVFPLAQFISTPIFGQLSDRFGRRPILLWSLLGNTFAYIFFAVGVMLHNLPILLLARIFGGFVSGNIAVAQSVVGDISQPNELTKNFGYTGAAFALGFLVGPFLGGQLASLHLSFSAPFWITAIICFANFALVYLTFPETKKALVETKKIDWALSVREIANAFSLPKVKLLLLVSFFLQTGFTFLTTFVNPFLIARFGWKELDIGNFFGYIGLWLIISQVFIVHRLSAHHESTVLKYSLLACGFFTFCLLLPTRSFWLFLIAPFFAISMGLAQANVTSLISQSSSVEKRGEIIGINSGIQALAQAMPPILAGFLAASLSLATPLFVSGSVLLLSGLLLFQFYKTPNVG